MISRPPRPILFLLILSLAYLGSPAPAAAQNLNGIKIQVAPDALTYFRFAGEIKRFEFGGDHDDYTGQVVENDQLRIKTLNPNPTPTNLMVQEGPRTHIFIIQVLKKIDINNFKAYYNFSDLKTLRKLAESGSAEPGAASGDNRIEGVQSAGKKDGKPDEVPVAKQDKKAQKKAEQERRDAEKAQQERDRQEAQAQKEQEAQARKEQEEADRKQAQAAKDKADAKERELAATKEKERLKQEAIAKAKEEAAAQKKLKAEQAARDKEAAAARAREQQLAKEKQQEEALARQRAEQEEKQRLKEEKEQAAREAQRKKDIAAAKEKDRQAAIARAEAQRRQEEADRKAAAQARRDQQAKEEAIAKEKERKRQEELARVAAAEKERQRQEELARKKAEAIEQERIRRDEAIRQQQLAIEQERQRREEAERQAALAKEQARIRQQQLEEAARIRKEEKARKDEEARQLAAVKAKERADALIKNPYWKTEWHKKYPQINFGEGPVGQLYAGEYFIPKDTLYNHNAAELLISDSRRLKKNYEEGAEGIRVKIENIGFYGVNCYFRIHVVNGSDKDYLVGKMQLTWWKKEGGGLFLNPVYVTDFPVISPGADATIVFACHGVNARDEDDFGFTMSDRLTGKEIQILFPGNLYNKQMAQNK